MLEIPPFIAIHHIEHVGLLREKYCVVIPLVGPHLSQYDCYFFWDAPDSNKDNVACQSSEGPAESVHVFRRLRIRTRCLHVKSMKDQNVPMLLIAAP